MIRTKLRPRLARSAALLLALGIVGPASAAPDLALQFGGPVEVMAENRQPLTTYALPVGGFKAGQVPARQIEGSLAELAWRLPANSQTTLDILRPLRDQIIAAGFLPIFECQDAACGGFDFRFGTPVLPEPQMHVDLGDFRFLSAARKQPEGMQYLSLLVSRSPLDGYVQLTTIGAAQAAGASPMQPDAATPDPVAPDPVAPDQPAPAGAVAMLASGLPVVLDGLVFASGAAKLEAGRYASIDALGAWLKANPGSSVMLVGHTDASGGLAANIALSRKRAESVRQVLVADYGVPAAQVTAEGVGPLAPRAGNLDEAGRQQNRRVEVFVTGQP